MKKQTQIYCLTLLPILCACGLASKPAGSPLNQGKWILFESNSSGDIRTSELKSGLPIRTFTKVDFPKGLKFGKGSIISDNGTFHIPDGNLVRVFKWNNDQNTIIRTGAFTIPKDAYRNTGNNLYTLSPDGSKVALFRLKGYLTENITKGTLSIIDTASGKENAVGGIHFLTTDPKATWSGDSNYIAFNTVKDSLKGREYSVVLANPQSKTTKVISKGSVCGTFEDSSKILIYDSSIQNKVVMHEFDPVLNQLSLVRDLNPTVSYRGANVLADGSYFKARLAPDYSGFEIGFGKFYGKSPFVVIKKYPIGAAWMPAGLLRLKD